MRLLPQVLVGPGYSLFFWMVVFLVAMQYRRMAVMERAIYGRVRHPVARQTLASMVQGVVGGLLGSFLMILVGVTLSNSGVMYLWPLALLLMAINPRLICFSYAGGIVSLSFLLLGFPRVSVPGIICLVAILHLVESFLIWWSGASTPTALFLRNHRGQVVGGFALQKFWPVPIAVLWLVTAADVIPSGGVAMPGWWPLIKPVPGPAGPSIFYSLFPVVAALGYGEVALARPPAERSRRSAVMLGLYSVVLLVLAVVSSRVPLVQWLAALFSALGHELVAVAGSRGEMRGVPLYLPPPRGVMILDVMPGSPAERMGLGSGDIILQVNGTDVNSREELREVLDRSGFYLEIKALQDGQLRVMEASGSYGQLGSLGVLLVPETGDGIHVELGKKNLLRSAWRWWTNRRKPRL